MKSKEILLSLTLLVVGIYFFIVGIIEASGFLKPLSIAVLLTLICIPFCRKLESWKLSRGLSALVSVVLSLLVFISFFTIITAQIANISERWPEIQRKMQPKLEEVQETIAEKTGVNFQKEFQMLYPPSEAESSTNSENDKQSSSSASKASSPKEMVSNASEEIGMIVMNFFNFMSGAVLTLVYLFFLLLYRNKVKLSVLKFFSKANRKEAEEVMNHSIELALNFIVGRVILIAFLAVIYSIGLSLSGIENAILISVIAAILSLVPFIGNIIGYGLSLVMAVFAGAELWGIIGVSITFGLAQFIESYILEPYVVGSKVEVNPLVTIVVVILGGSIWGIVGMILSIPIAGICKIIFDSIPALQPIGYALGEKDVEGADEENFLSKWGKNLWEKVSN
ncbi:AI-2E family transporter [Algoriphagus winogradskyi]|uniref:Predicted PurR-regulated permease PerM n=1 Tax=Algoriphagus winogradskyi TaxID=237017 RepID=A0ABY1N6L7_9BACT|nr:AI-2E family transporter [Algoriphagus winogradskyi]SMP01322.1 Predicted PurR-regulated permease PerM [Algoriphagus winogradskyi]